MRAGELTLIGTKQFPAARPRSPDPHQTHPLAMKGASDFDGLMWKDDWADLEGSRLSRGLVCNLVQHDLVQDARAELQVFDRRALAQAVEINRWPEP